MEPPGIGAFVVLGDKRDSVDCTADGTRLAPNVYVLDHAIDDWIVPVVGGPHERYYGQRFNGGKFALQPGAGQLQVFPVYPAQFELRRRVE